MKRFNWFLFAMFLIIASPAYCGVWESFKNNAFAGMVTLFFAILSGILGKKVMVYKSIVMKVYDAVNEFKSSLKEKSDGGKDITKAEWESIIAKFITVIESIFEILPVKWLPKKG